MTGPLAADLSPRSLWPLALPPIIVAILLTGAPASSAPGPLLQALDRPQTPLGTAETTRILRTWATLGASGVVPQAHREGAEQAKAWAETVGPLRVFASRVSPTRVRVGVDDPAHGVDRLDVYAIGSGGQLAQMTRAESEAAGRNEYVMPPGPARAVRVQAVMLVGGQRIVLKTVDLEAASADLPSAPKAAPAPPTPAVAAPVAPTATHSADIPWWWIAAASVAAVLVGTAVWQETRF